MGKNPAHLTEEDREAIDQMLLICGGELDRFLDRRNPKNDYGKISEYFQSRKNIAVVLLFLNQDYIEDSIYNAEELNKKLEEYTGYNHPNRKNVKIYLNESSMSKVLRTLVDENLLLSIRGREALKKVRYSQGKKKYQEYKEKFARGGYISIYEAHPDATRLKRVMSKPLVARTFRNALTKYSRFREYVKALLDYFIYMIRTGEDMNENIYEAINGANIHMQIDRSNWEYFRKWIHSLNEEQIEQVKEKITIFLMQNPLALHRVLYRLYKLPEYKNRG
jgi:hypothetical protein